MKVGDRVKYIVGAMDEAASRVLPGTEVHGVVAHCSSPGGVDIRWDAPELMGSTVEYGMPEELFEVIE